MLLTEEVDAFTMIHQFNNEMLKKKGRVFKISFDQNEGYAVFFGSVEYVISTNLFVNGPIEIAMPLFSVLYT